ncbi:Trp biosynthesis-associated membrane protein [Canibacter sp. lx-72]|uniref:Trp biosynthesis-associated membrane protein n=1 Tax=Canibacter zhuwentaonis TaxID=2837491 RepID=UPI001BDCCEBB|nr:Trp biosynthesis-associated membrane protein [Canibacter zhuwentaonis]MBT1017913.1 Trp biosynthesis-associated membrane protein [Canibacter zhuwentaonis]MBT1035076.1 Trp biosynthesis-associated membrane protein [Canibacter zhuwentaonis]
MNTVLSKRGLISAQLLLCAALLFSSVNTWATVSLAAQAADTVAVAVSGGTVFVWFTPVIAAIAICATVLALTRGFLRYVLAGLSLALSALTAWQLVLVVVDPLAYANSEITKTIGIAGQTRQELGAEASLSWAVFVALACVGLLFCAHVAQLLLLPRWAAKSPQKSRYETKTGGFESGGAQEAPETDRVSDWDMLSSGQDPSAPR